MLYAKIKQTRRPYSGEVLGTRIQLAYPNNSGNPRFDVWSLNGCCVSFQHKNLMAESSDLTEMSAEYIEQWLAQFDDEIELCCAGN